MVAGAQCVGRDAGGGGGGRGLFANKDRGVVYNLPIATLHVFGITVLPSFFVNFNRSSKTF